MRVLLTTDTIGGVWTYTKELTQGLLQRSHAVALVSFGRLPSPEQSAWCVETAERYAGNFEYVASDVPLEWMDDNRQSYAAAEHRLIDLAESFGADLLHTSQFCFGRLPVPIPRLIVAHSDVLSWAAACRPNGLVPSPWLTRYKDHVQRGLDSASAVVAPTHSMLQALADRFQLPDERAVISNGIDIAPSLTPPRRTLQAASAGRLWDPAKGIATLAHVDAPFPVFVAGEREHATESAPEMLGHAHLLGRLDEQQLHHLFRSSSIYLACSIYEPFGLAPLEAALCGCAILANDIPSLREVWGCAALYFHDADSLSALLKNLASDHDRLQKLQSRAMERASHMTRSHMVDCYVELYRFLTGADTRTESSTGATEGPSHVQ